MFAVSKNGKCVSTFEPKEHTYLLFFIYFKFAGNTQLICIFRVSTLTVEFLTDKNTVVWDEDTVILRSLKTFLDGSTPTHCFHRRLFFKLGKALFHSSMCRRKYKASILISQQQNGTEKSLFDYVTQWFSVTRQMIFSKSRKICSINKFQWMAALPSDLTSNHWAMRRCPQHLPFLVCTFKFLCLHLWVFWWILMIFQFNSKQR